MQGLGHNRRATVCLGHSGYATVCPKIYRRAIVKFILGLIDLRLHGPGKEQFDRHLFEVFL